MTFTVADNKFDRTRGMLEYGWNTTARGLRAAVTHPTLTEQERDIVQGDGRGGAPVALPRTAGVPLRGSDAVTLLRRRRYDVSESIEQAAECIERQVAQIAELVAAYRLIERPNWGHDGDLQSVSARLAEVLRFLQGDDR